jgi:hypothetical protein
MIDRIAAIVHIPAETQSRKWLLQNEKPVMFVLARDLPFLLRQVAVVITPEYMLDEKARLS